MLLSSKTVLILIKIVEDLNSITLYADNFFVSIELLEYLKEKYGCMYAGCECENWIGDMLTHLYKTPLRSRRWYMRVLTMLLMYRSAKLGCCYKD